MVTSNAFEDDDRIAAMYKKYINAFSEVDDNDPDFDSNGNEVKKGSNMRADQETYRQTINDNHAKQKQVVTDKENDVRQDEFCTYICMEADSMKEEFTTYKEGYFDLSLKLALLHNIIDSGDGPPSRMVFKNALIEMAAMIMKLYWEVK